MVRNNWMVDKLDDAERLSVDTLTFTFFFQYEQEEIRRRENLQKIPEFVRVKDNLRRTQMSEQ